MDLLIFLLLISFSAFFSASETAFFSLPESQVKLMERNRVRNAVLVARLKADSQRLLITLLVGNNIVNLSIASLATVLAIGYFESYGAGIAAGISTVVILLLGEIFPKSLAFLYKKKIVQWFAYPVYFFYILFYPASSLFVLFEKFMKKRMNFDERNVVSEEEIRIMAELGLEHGEINRYEREMIESIFKFDDIPVGQIMTRKKDIEALNGEVPVEQIAYRVSQSGFSRFPVYDGSPTDYIGYVHTNDVMRVLNSDDREKLLMQIASPITRVEESTNIEQVFRLMTTERSHMYLVHRKGEPEAIVGLVTMEDILEEIMGEIEDEQDHRRLREGRVRAQAK